MADFSERVNWINMVVKLLGRHWEEPKIRTLKPPPGPIKSRGEHEQP